MFREIEGTSQKVVREKHRRVICSHIIESFERLRNLDFSGLHLGAIKTFEQGNDLFIAVA